MRNDENSQNSAHDLFEMITYMHNIIEQRSLWPGLDCPSSGNFVEDHHLQKTLKGRWVVTGGIQGAWDAHKSHKEYLNC